MSITVRVSCCRSFACCHKAFDNTGLHKHCHTQSHAQDLFYITVLAALMGYTHPVPTLARARPPRRVLSLPLLTSTVMQIGVVVLFQVCKEEPFSLARPGTAACKWLP